MNFSDNANAGADTAQTLVPTTVVLAREGGVPFQLPLGKAVDVDPIAEWLSLMDVVQMLCPEWPVRDKPMLGAHWRI